MCRICRTCPGQGRNFLRRRLGVASMAGSSLLLCTDRRFGLGLRLPICLIRSPSVFVVCKMPEGRSPKRGAVQDSWQYNLGIYGSSSFFSQDEHGGIKPGKSSYSCCSSGLFMDDSLSAFSSFLRTSDKISDSATLFSSLSLLQSLFHPRQEPSPPPLIQRGSSCSEKYFRLSSPNAFPSSRANDMQCLGSANGPPPLFKATDNGTEHSLERKRCRDTGSEDRFLSLSLSMKDNGDVLQASTSFLAQKSLVDSAAVVHCKDTMKGVEDLTEEVGNAPKQAAREDRGFKLEAESAFNTTKHLWAGAVAAMISRTFVAPLERLKLEYIVRGEQKNIFQLIQSITASQGLRGFWKGNVVNLLRTAPFKAVNFYAYDTYRKILLQTTGNEDATNFERFVAGAAAGITATILCLPMDTIRTKMVAPGGETLGGVIGVCRHMIQTEGFFSLYKGLLPAIISMAPSGAVFYGVYDILKTAYLCSPEGMERLCNMQKKVEGKGETGALEQLELGPLRTLLYGAIAGACAEAATYPFEVVRRQLQMQVPSTRLSTLATCAKLVDQGGIGALYAGLTPSLLQVLPSAALSYFVYECMKIILHVR